jgi:hypothetical protein
VTFPACLLHQLHLFLPKYHLNIEQHESHVSLSAPLAIVWDGLPVHTSRERTGGIQRFKVFLRFGSNYFNLYTITTPNNTSFTDDLKGVID